MWAAIIGFLLGILKWAVSGLTHKESVKADDGVQASDDDRAGAGAQLSGALDRLHKRREAGGSDSSDSDGT